MHMSEQCQVKRRSAKQRRVHVVWFEESVLIIIRILFL